MRPRTIVVITIAAAVAVFLVVQDRVTASGARRYVALQQEASAGRGTGVTIDQVMASAIQRSVQQGLMWAALVLGVGLSAARFVARGSGLPRRSGPDRGVADSTAEAGP